MNYNHLHSHLFVTSHSLADCSQEMSNTFPSGETRLNQSICLKFWVVYTTQPSVSYTSHPCSGLIYTAQPIPWGLNLYHTIFNLCLHHTIRICTTHPKFTPHNEQHLLSFGVPLLHLIVELMTTTIHSMKGSMNVNRRRRDKRSMYVGHKCKEI